MSTTAKETPISKRLYEKPKRGKLERFKGSDLRSLSGKSNGFSVVTFKYNDEGFKHTYGVFKTPEDAMEEFSPYNLIWKKSSEQNQIGESAIESFEAPTEDGVFFIQRFVSD